jgi:multiple sugar transport system ATP-binding protein
VARLEPASSVRAGEEAELWVDASKIHLFDPEDGRNLTASGDVPAAADGAALSGREEPEREEGAGAAADEPPPAGSTEPTAQ